MTLAPSSGGVRQKGNPFLSFSDQALFDGIFIIANGFLTKKLCLFKDDNKTGIPRLPAVIHSSEPVRKGELCENWIRFSFDCLEKTTGSYRWERIRRPKPQDLTRQNGILEP